MDLISFQIIFIAAPASASVVLGGWAHLGWSFDLSLPAPCCDLLASPQPLGSWEPSMPIEGVVCLPRHGGLAPPRTCQTQQSRATVLGMGTHQQRRAQVMRSTSLGSASLEPPRFQPELHQMIADIVIRCPCSYSCALVAGGSEGPWPWLCGCGDGRGCRLSKAGCRWDRKPAGTADAREGTTRAVSPAPRPRCELLCTVRALPRRLVARSVSQCLPNVNHLLDIHRPCPSSSVSLHRPLDAGPCHVATSHPDSTWGHGRGAANTEDT